MYTEIMNAMREIREDLIREGKRTDDDAIYFERCAEKLGLNIDEHEDMLMDCAFEIAHQDF